VVLRSVLGGQDEGQAMSMNREDIIRMAQEAQMPFYWDTGEITYLDKLERFAALVAEAEREACAKVCESLPLEWPDQPTFAQTERATMMDCAAAIRARGQA
jgi:enoyl reductase-like protein